MDKNDIRQNLGSFKSIGKLVARAASKRLSPVQRRLMDTNAEILSSTAEQIAYQHTVLCQTGLPYRNPGVDVRKWKRHNGHIMLQIEAGSVFHQEQNDFVELPLPFGPTARLILIHLNTMALQTGSPVIKVEDSMTAFIRYLLGHEPSGREIRTFKNQLAALSTALIRFAVVDGTRGLQVDTKIVTAFDLWFPKQANQRILWPSTVRLSQDYFDSLVRHAVPLNETAVGALAHSAMGLDIYTWLAQRLHRTPQRRPQLLAWSGLQEQFGQGYSRRRDFYRDFLITLKTVHKQYPAARIEATKQGLLLHHSPPPVPERLILMDNHPRS